MSPQGTPEDRPVVDLPDPCLVLLVGPAGAGKSTFAHRHFGPDEIVSSDELREAIAGDAADQTRNRAVFGALARAVARRLAAGGTVVVDATNLERSARRPLLAQATLHDIPAVAIVLEVRLADAVDRDRHRRGRTVGPDVVARHHEQLGWLLASGHLDDEGFAAVHRLRGIEAVDAAVVRRTRGDGANVEGTDHDPGPGAGPTDVPGAP
jgi:protein phosphatase